MSPPRAASTNRSVASSHPRMRLVQRTAGVYVPAGAVRELADGRGAAVDDLGDLGVGVAEHLVQDEHRPLQRGQRLQDDEHRHRHGLPAQHTVGGVRGRHLGLGGPGHERLGQPGPDVRLASAADHGPPFQRVVHRYAHEVRARIVDLLVRRPVAAAGPGQPGVLEYVLGVRDAAEHVVDDREQQLAVVDEQPGRRGQCLVGRRCRTLGHACASRSALTHARAAGVRNVTEGG